MCFPPLELWELFPLISSNWSWIFPMKDFWIFVLRDSIRIRKSPSSRILWTPRRGHNINSFLEKHSASIVCYNGTCGCYYHLPIHILDDSSNSCWFDEKIEPAIKILSKFIFRWSAGGGGIHMAYGKINLEKNSF